MDGRAGRAPLVRALACALAACLVAGTAAADLEYPLTIGGTFNTGSGVAMSTNVGLYTGSRTLMLASTPTGNPDVVSVSVSGINPMPTVSIALDPTSFRFTLLSDPQLSFDRGAGINVGLSDPLVEVRVERLNTQGSVLASDTYMLPFTTGDIDLPFCGSVAPRTLSGNFVDADPQDGLYDEVELVAAICMVNFDQTMNFSTPLEIRFRGSMTESCPDPDDGIACTVDFCDPATLQVTNTPDDSLCADGDVCNGIEICDPVLDCQAEVPPPSVDDGIACTIDSCDPVSGISHVPDDAFCSDGNVCNGDEFCSPALDCQAGTPLATDDGVSCTLDGCDPVSGVFHTPDDGACSDGNLCTGAESCDPVLDCQPGVPVPVDDGVACTVDGCDPVTGVFHTPDDAVCDDGDVCTGTEQCDPVLDCRAGTPLATDDGVACTVDGCDPVTGVFHTPDDGQCSDGNMCTGVETCDAVLDCQPGTPVVVDDGVACTVDGCDPEAGVFHTPDHGVCSDGDFCSGIEICDAVLDCQPGTPLVVDDGVSCTQDECDPSTGLIAHLAIDALCDDGNLCTGAESCDPVLDCQAGTPLEVDDGIGCTNDGCHPIIGVFNTPDDSICGDGDVCNGIESCDPGLDCQPGTPLVVDDGVGCTIDSCNPIAGVFHTADDSLCTDGDVCNGTETCDPVFDCRGGVPLVVDDGVDCTVDGCDAVAGVFHTPDPGACSDGDVCNGIESCDPLLDCRPGTPLVADDGVGCTVDSCDPLAGVFNAPDDAACADGDVCNGDEFCDPLQDCRPGAPLVVDDGIGCTIDSCDPVAGVAHTPDDSVCDDDDVCNGDEFCSPVNDCVAGFAPMLDDGIACTVDLCDPILGVMHALDDLACNDGLSCNGTEFCDPTLDCQAGSPPPSLAFEDFEDLPLQSDTNGSVPPGLGLTFHSVTLDGRALATVVAVADGEAAIEAEPGHGKVWAIAGASEGPFIAEGVIPPDPDAGLPAGGTLGLFFATPRDVTGIEMCVDVRDASGAGARPTSLRFLVGDADGNYAISQPRQDLPQEFTTLGFEVLNEPLALLDGVIDLRRTKTLGFEFSTSEGAEESFRFQIDDLRLIPEPRDGLLAAAALAALALLRAARRPD